MGREITFEPFKPHEESRLCELETTGTADPFLEPINLGLMVRLREVDFSRFLQIKKNAFQAAGIYGMDFDRMIERAEESLLESTLSQTPCWDKAKSAPDFLAQVEETVIALAGDLIFPGALAALAAPYGTGKSMFMLALAVALARGGVFRGEILISCKVLYVDRDNPPYLIRQRLRGWEAHQADNLDVLTRNDAPPLTDRAAWATLPTDKYNVIVVDSMGASTEGVSEKESSAIQKVLATLKDLARRGPAVVVLDNTIKSGENYRGRGEKGDALDVLYEMRNITGWTPSCGEDWWRDLPDDGAAHWKARASRRSNSPVLRIAFIPAKFRLSIEPAPFAVEMDLTRTPYTLKDITADLIQAGTEHANFAREADRQRLETAARALAQELAKRPANNPFTKREAEDFLYSQDLKVREARNILEHGYNGVLWQLRPDPSGKGYRRIGVYPINNFGASQENGSPSEPLIPTVSATCSSDNHDIAHVPRTDDTKLSNNNVSEKNIFGHKATKQCPKKGIGKVSNDVDFQRDRFLGQEKSFFDEESGEWIA